MREYFICFPAVLAVALFFSGWLEGILSKCWSQLWCRIKTEKGGAEGRRRSDERMCGESGVCGVSEWKKERAREREPGRERFASPMWQSRSGSLPVLGTVPTRRQCVASTDWSTDSRGERLRDTSVSVGGVWGWLAEEVLVCICMWSGKVVIQQKSGKTAGKNEGRIPGQCYVTNSITNHRPGVYTS